MPSQWNWDKILLNDRKWCCKNCYRIRDSFLKTPMLFVLFVFCTFLLITFAIFATFAQLFFVSLVVPRLKSLLGIHYFMRNSCLLSFATWQQRNYTFINKTHCVLSYLSLHLSWKRSNLDPFGHRNVSLVIITSFDASWMSWIDELCLLQIWYNLQSDDKSL